MKTLLLLFISTLMGLSSVNNKVNNVNKAIETTTTFEGFNYSVGDGTVTILSSEDAASEELTAGYTGDVLKITGAQSNTVIFDFASLGYKTNEIASITFRVLANATANGKKPEFRVQNETKTPEWTYFPNGDPVPNGDGGASLASNLNTWVDLTIKPENIRTYNSFSVYADSNDSTILGKVYAMFRTYSNSDLFYIDSVTIVRDTKAADFTNNGQFTYTTSESCNKLLSYEDMASEGVASGYSNSVLKMSNSTWNSVSFNFNESNIKTCLIEKISFHVYCVGTVSGLKPEFRVQNETQDPEWVYFPNGDPVPNGDGGASLSTSLNTWLTLDITPDNIRQYKDFSVFASSSDPTRLGLISVVFRCSVTTDILYIDSVTVTMKENDGVAPVITYEGDTNVTFHQEETISIDATAFDAQENRNVDIEYVFGEGAIVENNAVTNIGNFTLTLKATDYFGNFSTVNLNLTIIEKDVTAPVIDLPDAITAKTGVNVGKIGIDSRISDDSGNVNYTITWSDGSYDFFYSLLEGVHTLTVEATDSSKNKTTKVVTVTVNKTGGTDGDITFEDEDYFSVKDFVNTYLTDENSYEFNDVKQAYNALSSKAKLIFNTYEEFASSKETLTSLADSNGAYIDSDTYMIEDKEKEEEKSSKGCGGNMQAMSIIIYSLAVVGIALLILKRKHQ